MMVRLVLLAALAAVPASVVAAQDSASSSSHPTMSELLKEFERSPMPRAANLTGDWVEAVIINTQRFLTGQTGPDHIISDPRGYRREGGKFDWRLSMQREGGRLIFVSTTLWTDVDRSPVSFNAAGELLFAKDYGGDAACKYRCRMPDKNRLICIFDGSNPGHAVEFRRMQ